jgi:hypothetical protein
MFGNPKKYEFDEEKIFKKCDEAGTSRVDLHFKMGMSSAKVFRVVLYRLNQIFTINYDLYLKSEIDYDILEESHKKLFEALGLSRKIYDKKVVKHLKEDLEDLYMLLNHQDTFDRFVLNFQVFIYEKSFYNSHKVDEPIHFFDKKEKLFKLIKEKR